MKIYFIEAEKDKLNPPTSDWYDLKKGAFLCPALALPTIASLSARGAEIKIIDEKIEEINHADLPDAACISFKSMSSQRAYELADVYRVNKVKVILGGIHASLMPEEASQHADSVVIGEGEEIWQDVMSDLESDRLKEVYRAPRLTDLANLPAPRFDLLKNESYVCHSIQSSRGCSLDCEFCPTREMFGGVFRKKPIKKVLEEIKEALSIERKYIFFTDDIFGAGDKDFMLGLLMEIRKLRIEFFIISDFLILNRKIVIELAKSGCRYMALNLPGTCSPEEARAIKMIQRLGINVWGYFMFGFRIHEKDVFKKAYDFTLDTGMKNVSFTVMAPYPNTKAGRELDKQGRILTKDWGLYDQAHVVFKPEKMSAEELKEGFNWIKNEMGRLSHFRSDEKRPLFETLSAKCLVRILGALPDGNRR